MTNYEKFKAYSELWQKVIQTPEEKLGGPLKKLEWVLYCMQQENKYASAELEAAQDLTDRNWRIN